MNAFLILAAFAIFFTISVDCKKCENSGPPIPGGVTCIDPSEPEVRQIIEHGLENLNAGEAREQPLRLRKLNYCTIKQILVSFNVDLRFILKTKARNYT
jgi:hypothetical protein